MIQKYFTKEEKNLKKKRYDKEYYQKHKEEKILYQKEYYQNNKKKVIKKVSEWCQNNREKRNKYHREYDTNRRKTDTNFKLTYYLRSRLYKAIKNNQKAGSAIKDLGCSVPELKLYLGSKFQQGMTWDNYGKWHIDHIKPLDAFNLQNREEFLKAVHYTNLQPMWAKENLKKGKIF